MRPALILLMISATLLTACGGAPQSSGTAAARPTKVALKPCDDGGSGGVLIDGVCL